MDEVIAVTGATGAVGGRVARLLSERGIAPRLIVRDPDRAPELRLAEVRTAPGYGASEAMRAALAGVTTLFLVPAAETEDRVEQHHAAIDAAVAADVRRIVYLSFLDAAPDSTFTLVHHHWATEEHIRRAGVAFTFPRMNLYLDFVPGMVGADGVLAGPAGDGRVAMVARADVADVVVTLLTTDGHDGRVYDVTGGEALTLEEVAAVLSDLAGTRIAYKDETLEEAWASRAGYGAPDWQVEAWISTYTAIAAGELARVTDTVERLAGRPPTTLAEYVRTHPDCLDHVHR